MTTNHVPHHDQLLRLPAVISRTGLSRSSIYRAEADPDSGFPKRVKVGKRATAWLASEIDSWISRRVAASREEAA